jgi:glycosyltransferase involved in cell wall biosynthesis
MARLIVDVSTNARWSGPPVGIVRVEQEIALQALRRGGDVELAFHDPSIGMLRPIAPGWRDLLVGPGAVLETIWLDVRRHQPRWRRALAPRYPVVMALERARLAGVPLAGAVQRLVLGRHGRVHPFVDDGGRRMAVVPFGAALGPPVAPGPGDTVLSAGTDWLHKGGALVGLSRRHGFRLAVLCYDLLPLTHPEWFFPEDVARFGAYWRQTIPAAARILCNADCVAQDLRDFARAEALGGCEPVVVPLGYAPPRLPAALPPLPAPLAPGRFALFVSTVEPRKGHAVLVEAWRALLARGVPQRAGFHLVFAGRRGWMVDDVMREIAALSDQPDGQFLHLDGPSDATLARLYREAAFCLYPSRAEGFGLPVIEAMAQGKAVIASTGGAVPQTAGGLAPCLDPLDVPAWTAMLAEWITDPAARGLWEARILRDFRHLSWPEAAEGIIAAALA